VFGKVFGRAGSGVAKRERFGRLGHNTLDLVIAGVWVQFLTTHVSLH
jgi:hypothetical protein